LILEITLADDVCRLEKVWINKDPESDTNGGLPQASREESVNSNVSLGDTHIWRDDGDRNV